MRRLALGGSAILAVIAVMLLAVPAAAKKPPPNDHGFPLDQYIHDASGGRFFIGGDPPKVLGAKTKDTVFVVKGKAHYQAQLGFRRVGRDNGHGKFLVLKARSWASALAYVLGLDPGIARSVHTVFPKALFSRSFPPLYAQITYTFEIAPTSNTSRFEKVPVASEPHPDPALRKKGVALVTLKRGVTPGTYLVRVPVKVSLAAHPLKRLYEAYETATGAIEWLSLVGKPAEVVLEKAVEKTIATLVERAAKGDQAAVKLLSGPAYREKIAKKKLESWVTSAVTETETRATIEVPTVVPDLTKLNRPRALRKLEERFLRYTWINDGSRSCGKGPGQVKSQSVKPGTKVKVDTRVRVRICTKPAPAPRPAPKPGTGSRPTRSNFSGVYRTNFGGMVLKQTGDRVTGCYTHDQGTLTGTVSGKVLSGTWKEAPHKSDTDRGGLIFTRTSSGFTGRWNYDGDGGLAKLEQSGSSGGSWTGTMTGGDPPCTP